MPLGVAAGGGAGGDESMFHTLRTGYYYSSFIRATGQSENMQFANNSLHCFVHPIPRDMTWDRIGIYVQGAAPAGSKARLGLYCNGENLYPGSLLLDAGEVDIDEVGWKEIIINQATPKGVYYLAYLADEIPYVYATEYHTSPIGSADHIQYSRAGWQKQAYPYAVLPDTFPSGGSFEGDLMLIGMRLASLD